MGDDGMHGKVDRLLEHAVPKKRGRSWKPTVAERESDQKEVRTLGTVVPSAVQSA